MLTFEMLTGFPPWYSRDRKKLIRRVKYAPLKMPSGFSPALASFIEELLLRHSTKRLGELQHQHHQHSDAGWLAGV